MQRYVAILFSQRLTKIRRRQLPQVGKPYIKSAYRLIIKALELKKLSPFGESVNESNRVDERGFLIITFNHY